MLKKWLLRVMRLGSGLIAVIFALLSLFWGYLAYSRQQLPYNENGRYYDSLDSVVYDEMAVFFYGLLAFLFAIGSLILIVIAKGLKKLESHAGNVCRGS